MGSAGNLFGTSSFGGASYGTAFHLVTFAGIPREATCVGQSISALVQQYGGVTAAAVALGFFSVQALQNAILAFCSPRH